MDGTPSPGGLTRSPVEALRTSLVNGINRYRAMKDAPESRRLLSAFAVMWIGARLNTVALVVLSFQIGDGALGVGGMLAMTLLPLGIFQPIAGTLVDKFPGKRLLVITYALFTVLAFSYLLLIPFASIWLLYLIRFLSGTLQAVETPAYEVRLMMLTPNKKRGTANAVQAMAMEVGEIIGPLLGGVILAFAGPSPLFILNGLSIAFLGVIIWRLPESVDGAHRVIEDGDVDAVAEEAAAKRGGYRWLLKRPEIVAYMAMTLGSGALGYGTLTLFVGKALDIGINEGSIGVFFSAIGVGALLGGIFAGMGEYASRRALILSGVASIVAALSIISFGFSGSFILAVVALFAYGLVINLEEIPALTYFQNRLPEAVYGRFFSIFMMAASLGGLGGSLLIPFFAERNGMVTALAIIGLPTMVFALLFAVRGGGLRLTRPFIPLELTPAPAEVAVGIPFIDEPAAVETEASLDGDGRDV